MAKNFVIFDGSNFYHGSKKLAPQVHLTNFNYRSLAELITENQDNSIQYCVGEIKRQRGNPKSERMYAGQQALFYNLEQQGVAIKKGFMLKTDDVYREKGVDVRIAIDILWGAFKNEYEKCFVISTDTDIIPAIQDAISLGKAIIYVGFENFISRALKLSLHPDKITLKTLASGIDFLGWMHFPHHRVLRTTTKRRAFRRIYDNAQNETLQSYLGLLGHGNTHRLQEGLLNWYALWHKSNEE